MKAYKLTAFDASGEKLLDETIQAANDEEAKAKGTSLLEEKNLQDSTHRCISPSAKLILFHR